MLDMALLTAPACPQKRTKNTKAWMPYFVHHFGPQHFFCRTHLSSLDRRSLKLIAGLILSMILDPALPLSLLALALWLSLGTNLRMELMQDCAHQVQPLQCQPPMRSMMLISWQRRRFSCRVFCWIWTKSGFHGVFVRRPFVRGPKNIIQINNIIMFHINASTFVPLTFVAPFGQWAIEFFSAFSLFRFLWSHAESSSTRMMLPCRTRGVDADADADADELLVEDVERLELRRQIRATRVRTLRNHLLLRPQGQAPSQSQSEPSDLRPTVRETRKRPRRRTQARNPARPRRHRRMATSFQLQGLQGWNDLHLQSQPRPRRTRMWTPTNLQPNVTWARKPTWSTRPRTMPRPRPRLGLAAGFQKIPWAFPSIGPSAKFSRKHWHPNWKGRVPCSPPSTSCVARPFERQSLSMDMPSMRTTWPWPSSRSNHFCRMSRFVPALLLTLGFCCSFFLALTLAIGVSSGIPSGHDWPNISQISLKQFGPFVRWRSLPCAEARISSWQMRLEFATSCGVPG